MKGKLAKVMVPISGHDGDRATMEFACLMAKLNKGRVYAVHVIRVKRSLPLDATLEPEIRRAEELFNQAEDIADEQDCPLETELLQSREEGPALVEDAVQQDVDIILISIEHKQGGRFRESMLNSTTSYVLKNAPCAVCLLRHPPSEK